SVASFAPAAAGAYTLSLVVNDGTENSAPDQVNVQAITPLQCVSDAAAAAIATINDAAATDIDAIGHREALVNFVEQGRTAAQNANPALALTRFGEALRRTDGCTLRGAPDPGGVEQDWMIGCAPAQTAYTHIRRAMDCAALPPLVP
ncbi:MAG TPA: hypothetical protein VFP70_13175, partial [Burkholderiales bacterium]|nr:hypothetical protein [Burkholderiales bacterium]